MVGMVPRGWILPLAVHVLACAARPAPGVDDTSSGDADELGDTESTTSSGTSTSTSTTTTSPSETETESSQGESTSTTDCAAPVKLDLPPEDSQPSGVCTVSALGWDALALEFPDCVLCNDGNGCNYDVFLACVELGPDQTCAELCPSGNCGGSGWGTCEGWPGEPDDWCGPYELAGQCCTVGKVIGVCAE